MHLMVKSSTIFGYVPSQTISELGIDILVKTGIGYGIGCITQSNCRLWALILATQSIASMLFYEFGKVFFFGHLRCKTISELSRAASYTLAFALLNQVGLISIGVAGLMEAVTIAFLIARISWIQKEYYPVKQ